MGEAQPKIKPSCLEINVCGRVEAIEQIQGKQKQFYASTIIIPAEDTFSRPARVIVNSNMPFGEEGTMVDTIVHVVPQWRTNDGKWYFSCNLWKDKLGS